MCYGQFGNDSSQGGGVTEGPTAETTRRCVHVSSQNESENITLSNGSAKVPIVRLGPELLLILFVS